MDIHFHIGVDICPKPLYAVLSNSLFPILHLIKYPVMSIYLTSILPCSLKFSESTLAKLIVQHPWPQQHNCHVIIVKLVTKMTYGYPTTRTQSSVLSHGYSTSIETRNERVSQSPHIHFPFNTTVIDAMAIKFQLSHII